MVNLSLVSCEYIRPLWVCIMQIYCILSIYNTHRMSIFASVVHHSFHLHHLSPFLIFYCFGLLASVSTSAQLCFCCLCNTAFATVEFVDLGAGGWVAVVILLGANTSSSIFFDEKHCQKVFTFLPFHSLHLQCSDSFPCIFLHLSQQV